ncbi:glycosyltransferase [Robertmurraya sp.]|uniref:glycosyltransferase n=1 Tax=Robertmurraya sp. TaxID=2837525 RepID=UPI0037039795
MIKILFFIESLAGGGAEKVLTDIVKKVNRNMFDITIITVVDVGVYMDEVKRYCGYQSLLSYPGKNGTLFEKIIYKIKYRFIYNLPTKWVYKYFIKTKFDVEVGFVEGFATKFISSSSNKDSKKIAWVHVDPIERQYADSYWTNLTNQINSYKKYNKVVCVSKSVKESFERKFFTDPKIKVIYNPVDNENILEKSKVNSRLIRPNQMLLGTIGRLTDQKGYDRLIRVIKRLKNEEIEVVLWILGEGIMEKQLKEYINNNNLSNNVKLLGFQENPYSIIKQCDLFVCSSRAEGFSLAIAESITLGLPILSTDCSGPNELLGYGKYGFLVKNDEDSLYAGIKILLNDKKLLQYYKNRSNERKRHFSIDRTIKEIEEILI